MVVAMPSRFIAEMAISQASNAVDPMEKLRALRAELAQRASLNPIDI